MKNALFFEAINTADSRQREPCQNEKWNKNKNNNNTQKFMVDEFYDVLCCLRLLLIPIYSLDYI